MKTIFRFSGLAVLAAAFFGFGTAAALAQTPTPAPAAAPTAADPCADADGQTALYTKFTELYPKTDIPSRQAAIDTAKQFLEKYGACAGVKEQNDYFKTALPKLEEALKKVGETEELKKLFARFDAGINSDNADEVYAAGKLILAKQPDNINILVPMGVVGAYQSTAANNFKYSGDGLTYANMALSKVKGGTPFTKKDKSGAETAGALKYELTRELAKNELTYAVAYLSYYGKKDKATALPLYYELTQGTSAYKEDPRIYGTIGDYYIEQRKPLGEQIRTKIEEQKKEGEAVEIKEAREVEIKKLVALFNGYNERILDAYGRAYKVTKDTPANKAFRDNLYKIMQEIYKSRFDKDTGLNEYIAATVAKPFPNPTTEVTPVADPEPAKTTTTSGTAPATAQPAANTAAPTANGKTAATTKPIPTPAKPATKPRR